jgi:MFS family permease
MFPLRIGLAAAAVVLLCFTISETVLVVAGVVVLAAVALGSFWAPAMAMLSDAAESRGIGLGYAMALINLAWAAGQIIGAAGGGALAKATGDGVPFAISAALCATTLGLMLLRPVRAALPR